MMVRKSCLEQLGYLDEQYLAWQDDSLCLSMAKKNYRFKHCEAIVAHMFPSSNSISRNSGYKFQGIKRIVGTYKKDIIENNGRFRYLLWKMRILLNHINMQDRTLLNRFLAKILRKYLSWHFEHIWG